MKDLTRIDLKEMVLRLAHEIRNPLATIKSGIQLVQHLMPPQPELQEYLESALEEVERINRTIADMQRVVRLDQGSSRAVALEGIVRAAVDRCMDLARRRDVTVRIQPGPESTVLVDPSQMEEAVAELVHNAVTYTSQGTSVSVSWFPTGGATVQLDVTDCCGGIPATVAERMFSPFYSSSTKGTGLGLNVASRTCELTGGQLKWENLADGSGCRFSIVLPEV